MEKLTAYEIYRRVKKENLTHEQYKQLLLDNGIIIKKACVGETSNDVKTLPIPDVSGELCRCTGIMEIEKIKGVVWCKKCRKKFLAV